MIKNDDVQFFEDPFTQAAQNITNQDLFNMVQNITNQDLFNMAQNIEKIIKNGCNELIQKSRGLG